MASGHVNRVNRPNIWLLRPSLQSEDSSCQPGAVHTWPKADMAAVTSDVRFRGWSGHGARQRPTSAFLGTGALSAPLIRQSPH